MNARKLLGKSRTLGSRSIVYEVEDGLEIEVREQYDVTQRRVLYDDVLMVTIHREMGPMYLLGTGAIALFFLGIGILILSVNIDAWPAAAVFGVFGFPAFFALVLRLMFGLDVVTVFGRRSKASMRFGLRKKRAREVYASVCAAVRHAHQNSAHNREPVQA